MGETPSEIAAHENVPVDFVLRVFAHMDAALWGDPEQHSHSGPITPGTPCIDCGRPMVPSGRHAPGHVQHRGHGRCSTCCGWLRRRSADDSAGRRTTYSPERLSA